MMPGLARMDFTMNPRTGAWMISLGMCHCMCIGLTSRAGRRAVQI